MVKVALAHGAVLGRHEAAVDEDDVTIGQLQGRQHPVAGAQHGTGLHEGLVLVQEGATHTDLPVFIVITIDGGPVGRRRQGHRGRMDARIDSGDKVELPRTPLDLPGPQRDEQDEQPQQQHGHHGACHR